MMNRQRPFKRTALLLAFLFLVASVPMTILEEGHAIEHDHQQADHASHHAKLACTWMCAASTFVHSADPAVDQSFSLFYSKPTFLVAPFLTHLSVFSIHIRPPPFI